MHMASHERLRITAGSALDAGLWDPCAAGSDLLTTESEQRIYLSGTLNRTDPRIGPLTGYREVVRQTWRPPDAGAGTLPSEEPYKALGEAYLALIASRSSLILRQGVHRDRPPTCGAGLPPAGDDELVAPRGDGASSEWPSNRPTAQPPSSSSGTRSTRVSSELRVARRCQ
ncbi:hypothetical protein GCM10022207_92240 [Streptomyces lannensis]|uniref:Uncharacterized protein n=1 Tax=Streptomyces lannensis TaxID=766498 RepID=A0ABP7LV53_9ACTN